MSWRPTPPRNMAQPPQHPGLLLALSYKGDWASCVLHYSLSLVSFVLVALTCYCRPWPLSGSTPLVYTMGTFIAVIPTGLSLIFAYVVASTC